MLNDHSQRVDLHAANPLLTREEWPYTTLQQPPPKLPTPQPVYKDTDWMSSEDDDIIFNQFPTPPKPVRTFDEQSVYNQTFGIGEDAPIRNMLLFHPAFNTENPEYQAALGSYQMMFGQKQDHEPLEELTFRIKTPIIDVPIRDPTSPTTEIKIRAAADTGSEIDCIGPRLFDYYKSKGRTKYSKEGRRIRTGNGLTIVHHYIPVTLKTSNNRCITTKFWRLENLPSPFDWLIGVSLLKSLGWELTNKYVDYEHVPTNIDDLGEDLDDPACSNYPLFENEPEVDVTKIKVGEPTLREFVQSQLHYHRDCLAKHEWDSGRIHGKEFEINFIDEDHPLKDQGFISKEYGMKPQSRKEVRRQLQGMKDHRIISRCYNAKYVSSLFAIPKKTGDVRIVFDFRKLNMITKKLKFPIPLIDDLLNKFKGKAYVSSLDMKGGYWHIPLKSSHRNRTAFIFEGEVYQFNVLPFGPTNAPMFFQEVMHSIFGHLPYVVVYLDDISILSDTAEEHKEHLAEVFKLLNKHCIKLRLDKCLWAVQETEYLGFIVDKYGVKTNPKYVQKILNVPEPRSKSALRRFIGLCQFLHRFIPQMQIPLSKLTPLTKSSTPKRFTLNEEQSDAFKSIKQLICKCDHLRHPNLDEEFHVFTDASKFGIGGMLAQWNEDAGQYQPVAYCSKVFNETQQRWHVSEQELYAAIHCIERWNVLLQHRKFVLHTDHSNLRLLFNKATEFKSGKLFRWSVRVQDFHFECRYIKGHDNVMADFLSRDSVLLNHPQYAKVKDFYETNPYHHPTRERSSNNGVGVDILTMYTMHMTRTLLMGKRMSRYQYKHPYLDGTKQLHGTREAILSKTPYTSDKERVDDVDSIASIDQLNDTSSPPPYQQRTAKRGITTKNVSFPSPRYSEDHDVSKRDDTYDEYVPSPTEQAQLQTNNVDGDRIRKSLRSHSKRQREQIESKESSETLEIRPEVIPIPEGRCVPNGDIDKHTLRELVRKIHCQKNADIINKRPYVLSWNKNLLDNRCTLPISNYYGSVISEDSHLSRQLLRAKQRDDTTCSNIIDFLETKNKARIQELPQFLQRFVVSGRFLINEDNILCWKQTTAEKRNSQNEPVRRKHVILKVAPASLRASLLKFAHSDLHHGRSRMMRIIQKELGYWWPRMNDHIAMHANCCNTCQHVKNGGYRHYKRFGQMRFFSSTRPFQQISVDLVGPLPTTATMNRYIVTMLDAFSRYCMLVAVPDVRAFTVIKAIDRWISLFGPPQSILSDNGPQFISALYRDYLSNHNDIKIKYTSTYHPMCNGQVERLHKWLKERLRLIAYDGALNFVSGDDDWSQFLDVIQYTFNSTPNRITTYSPMNIVLGRDDYKVVECHFDPNNPFEYNEYLRKRQNIIHSRAIQKQEQYDIARKRSVNRNRKSYDFEVGQQVLWNINEQFTGNARKLGPRWIGPYEIEEIFNDGQSYRIKVIPPPPQHRSNPMNERKVPRRAELVPRRGQTGYEGRRNWRITTPSDVSFTVPRCQIKPYHASYEERSLGLLSPITLATQCLLHILEHDEARELLTGNHRYDLHTPPIQWSTNEEHHMLMYMLKTDETPFITSRDTKLFDVKSSSICHQYRALFTLQLDH